VVEKVVVAVELQLCSAKKRRMGLEGLELVHVGVVTVGAAVVLL